MFKWVRGAAIGGCVLAVSAALLPVAAAANPTSPRPDDPGSASPSSRPAISTSYKLDPTPFALQISPARLIIGQAEIGTTQALTLVNRGEAPVVVEVSKRNFVAAADGSLTYQRSAPYGAASWVKLSRTDVTIAPGATQIVTAKVTAPPVPEPGDHQVAIMFIVAADPSSKANIKINRGMAMPVYITVPGRG